VEQDASKISPKLPLPKGFPRAYRPAISNGSDIAVIIRKRYWGIGKQMAVYMSGNDPR
jgi:hypothetical protein